MNPGGLMWFQAAMFALVTSALAFSSNRWLAPGIALAMLLVAIVLNHGYARSLRFRPRHVERAEGDRTVAIQLALVVALPLACFAIASAVDALHWTRPKVTVAVCALAVLWWSTYASCLVDWYYVRPRRDGVVVAPPCRTSGYERWTTVTRIWYLHRASVVIVCVFAAVVAATVLGLQVFDGSYAKDPLKVGSFVVAGAVAGLGAARLFYGSVSTIGDVFTTCVFAAPDISIGDKLEGPGAFVGGYVRDIALEGLTVVPLDESGRPLKHRYGRTRTKRHALAEVLDKPDVQGVPFNPCVAECTRVNEDCHWLDLRRHPDGIRKHRFIV